MQPDYKGVLAVKDIQGFLTDLSRYPGNGVVSQLKGKRLA